MMLAAALPGEGMTASTAGITRPEPVLSTKDTLTVRQVMDELADAYGVSFVYDSSIGPMLGHVAREFHADSLEDALRQLFEGTGVVWKLQNRYVVLKKQATGNTSSRTSRGRFTVSGFITDSASGETLIGAGASDGDAGAVTNNFGYYTLTVPAGKNVLTYSYLGCEPVTEVIDVRKDTVVNVELSQSVSIEASRVVARKDAGISSTYMGAIEIPGSMIGNTPAVLGEADLLKTVQMMPGVQGGMNGFSGIYVRGGGADENLMLIDGISLYNVSHLLGLFSVFTPESVKKATLYKGPFPARYGGRASSVLDVRTNDGNANGFHGSVSAGLLSEKLHFEGPIGSPNTTYSLSARGMHTFLLDPLARLLGSPANYAFYDINAKIAHRISDSDRISAGFYMGRDYFRYSDSDKRSNRYYGPDYEPYERLTDDMSKIRMNWGNTVGVLRWNHIFNGNLFLDASAYVNRYRMNVETISSYWEKDAEAETRDRMEYGFFSGILDIGARADFEYVPMSEHLVKFGAEYVRHAFNPETERSSQMIKNNDVVMDTTMRSDVSNRSWGDELSFYAEDDITLGDHFSLNPGLRLSLFHTGRKVYFCPEPRLSFKASFGKGWAVKTAYSRMSQYVHQLASGNLSLPSDLWVPITGKIPPVKSRIVSAGGYYGGLEGWEFSLELYWKKLDNVLEYLDGKRAFTSSSGWESNVAVGEGRSYGAELYVRKTVGRTTGSVSYTLSKSDRIFRNGSINNGRRFPFVYDRRHNLCVDVNQRIGKRIDLSAVWRFDSGHWMTVPEGWTIVMDDQSGFGDIVPYIPSRNNYHLSPSHRLDLSMNIHKKTRRGENVWNVSLCNAYGARNPDWVVTDRTYYRGEDGKEETRLALSVRSFLLLLPSFRYTFNF